MGVAFTVRPVVGVVILALAAANALQWYAARRSEQEVIDEFAKLWLWNPGPYHSRWLGIPVLQNPMDVWIIQELIQERKPDFVVETGTFKGGSAAVWATVLEQVNPEGRVLSIDIEDQAGEARALPVVQRSVDFLIGDSTDPKLLDEVRRRVGGREVLVVLDSDHSREHVLAELRGYAPLVRVGGYIVVQDTVIGHPVPPRARGSGAWEAVTDFMDGNGDWEIDRSRERLLFTMHPRGYLARVR